jgi:hypothetical protein
MAKTDGKGTYAACVPVFRAFPTISTGEFLRVGLRREGSEGVVSLIDSGYRRSDITRLLVERLSRE